MSTSRKTYVAVAGMLAQLRSLGYEPRTLDRVTTELCELFASDNPGFLPGRFCDAAGMTEQAAPALPTREEIAADQAAQYSVAS